MSDIRFNRWLHQSGTGGVYQDSSGRVGIGTSAPTSALDVQSGTIKIGNNTLSSSGVSTFSSGIVVSAGSTSTPSISPSGDSNTGIFFPSPDTIAFGEGGVEALRIDSNANIGIGTTNPQSKVHIYGSNTNTQTELLRISGGNRSGDSFETGFRVLTETSSTNSNRHLRLICHGQTGFSLQPWETSTGNAAIDKNILLCPSGGNVGIGTETVGAKLYVSGGNIKVDSGYGIDFSATANSSGTMSSELLSDYEEGTWTPVDNDGDAYTLGKVSTYVKIGRWVWVMCDVQATSTANGSKIGGLPFTAYGSSGTSFPGNYPAFNGYASGASGSMVGHINAATTQITLFVGSSETSLLTGQRVIMAAMYLAA